LDVARSGGADSVVLDLKMPHLDGLTFLTLLRENPATGALPVLVCTSKLLTPHEHTQLTELRAPFLSKDELRPESLLKGLTEARAWSLSTATRDTWPTGAVR